MLVRVRIAWIAILLTASGTAFSAVPLALHPENPRYFIFRGEPTVLVGSSEHYGAVMNLDFDYVRYLNTLEAANLNATRLFTGTYREPEETLTKGQAGNTLVPRRERFLAPWARTDRPGAVDGGNKFDLTRWDEDYFARLRAFVQAASERGIIVEVSLFSSFYPPTEYSWSVTPLNTKNNINGVGKASVADALSLKDEKLLAAHDAMVRKIATELNRFDNVYYEICNEPFFGVPWDWQAHIAATIASTEASLPAKHLIAQEVSLAARKIDKPIPHASMFAFHTSRTAGAVPLNHDLAKPIGNNETGFDGIADAPYRIESWQMLLAGGAFVIGLDYSFTVDHEGGSFVVPAGQWGGGSATLRTQLGILHAFMKGLNFLHMVRAPQTIRAGVPKDATAHVFAEPGKSYAIYVHHGRALTSDQDMIDVENGITPEILTRVPGGPWYAVDSSSHTLDLTLDLEPGTYIERWMNPKTGVVERTRQLKVAQGEAAKVQSPEYSEDIVLRIEADTGAKVIVRPDGAVTVPGFEIPLSVYMSDEAKHRVMEQGSHPAQITGSTIAEVRKSVDDWYRAKVERAKKIYPVEIAQQSLAGVRMAAVTPVGGVGARNRDRVLLNLHGGGFVTGAGNGGLAESIPIAAIGRLRVLSIDYRMAPEHRFPAATEDVVKVYRELLRTHSPRSIGIYGCSAGGLLTAQVVAWLQKEGLPAPGAIGIFCLGADALAGGDSRYLATPLEVSLGRPSPSPPAQPNPPLLPMQYLDGVDLRDPLVSPVFSRAVLQRFPPTLLISGSRDLGLSSILHTHAELTAAGADASLHVWEGMGHNFLVEMDLPESRAAYAVIVRHFDRNLIGDDAN